MVKGTAASTMLKRLDNERALKGVQSLSSIFQKVRSGAVSGACAHPNALAFVCFVMFRLLVAARRSHARPRACCQQNVGFVAVAVAWLVVFIFSTHPCCLLAGGEASQGGIRRFERYAFEQWE